MKNWTTYNHLYFKEIVFMLHRQKSLWKSPLEKLHITKSNKNSMRTSIPVILFDLSFFTLRELKEAMACGGQQIGIAVVVIFEVYRNCVP